MSNILQECLMNAKLVCHLCDKEIKMNLCDETINYKQTACCDTIIHNECAKCAHEDGICPFCDYHCLIYTNDVTIVEKKINYAIDFFENPEIQSYDDSIECETTTTIHMITIEGDSLASLNITVVTNIESDCGHRDSDTEIYTKDDINDLILKIKNLDLSHNHKKRNILVEKLTRLIQTESWEQMWRQYSPDTCINLGFRDE